MASKRTTELRTSLLRELEAVSQREGYSRLGRLTWLRSELENYLDRWLGAVAMDGSSYSSLLQNDLFTLILVATEIYEEELGTGGVKSGEVEWRQFRADLARAHSSKDRSGATGLRPSLVAVGEALKT